MASDPKRRRRRSSIDLPPDLSELMNKLTEHATSFIREFRTKRPEMTEIVEELKKIADEVRRMQERTDTVRTVGAVAGGIGLAGILAALFTGGLSLAAAAAAPGAAVVVGANIAKIMKENGSVKKVEQFGKTFMKIVEPLKNDLEEIKTTCGKMEQIKTEDEASSTLSDVEKFRRILSRVSELAERSNEALIVAAAVMEVMRDLVMFIVSVLRVTAMPEEDKKLRDTIIQSADQSKEVISKFDRMAEELEAVIEK